jgi:Mn2+/Fe2+ NRAMP family transporter
LKNIGPGTLVAAAFIGPGTVTVCTLAGVKFGFTLLWAMALSIVATIVLQEMAARLGIIHGKGLAATVKAEIRRPIFKNFAVALILSAILIGNAAYEAGNLGGGVLGLQTVFQNTKSELFGFQFNYLSFIIGAAAFAVLYIGKYKTIERSLIFLVILMSVSFLITAILTRPDIVAVLKGMFRPQFPDESLLTVIALVGTTVVPYNLFLHASLVKEKWQDASGLSAARYDTYISILLGGLVSMAIIICAAAVQSTEISNAGDLAKALRPLYGEYSNFLLSIGMFAAGITSAITAPLAAAYVARELFDWQPDLKSASFRGVWMVVLLTGVMFASFGINPIEIIKFAQVANGLLLPVIAAFLLWVVNRREVMGTYRNTGLQNILGLLIVLTTLILSIRSLYKVFWGI